MKTTKVTRADGEHDPGSMTTITAVIIMVIGVLAVALMGFGAAGYRQEYVQDVADLAAISAATQLQLTNDPVSACQVAHSIAPDVHILCEVEEPDVRITATLPPMIKWITTPLTAQAVAGPADP
ncbi:MAG: flp pilus-assembly TadE/G-like family protein [Actinomycetaceae bacterium]|nr:flp pilus-assembly TadE/G-like family protein [Actinomycetaceae bacterium]